MAQLTNRIYPKSSAQDAILSQETFSVHKGISQIPIFFTTDHEIDFDLMRKVIDIEIERNDALRNKITKTKITKKFSQTFVPPYKYADIHGEIPLYDFTGKTADEQSAFIKKTASEELKYDRFELFRVCFVKTFDNKFGLLLSIAHIVSDSWGDFVTLSDILGVYLALKNGTELPKSLASYEACLEKDLKEQSRESEKKNLQIMVDSLQRYGKITRSTKYTGVIDERLPHKVHKSILEKMMLFTVIRNLFNDKSENIVFKLPKDVFDKWVDFCKENSVSLTSLVSLGASAYFSKINNSNDFIFSEVCNYRATLAEKHSAGDRASAIFMRNIPDDTDTAMDVLLQLQNLQNQFFRLPCINARLLADIFIKVFKSFPASYNGAFQLSCIVLPLDIPQDWNCDYEIITPGYFAYPEYMIVLPDISNNSIKFSFEYQTRLLNEIQINAHFEGIVDAVNACVENKDRTYKQLKDCVK